MSVLSNSLISARRLLLKIPRAGRYIRPVLRHATPRKLANVALVEAEMRLGRTVLKGRPYYYLVDICNLCNLRCPLCPTGNGTFGREQGIMSVDEFKGIIEKIKEDALVVSLYNHGEPFLNKDVLQIVEYTNKSNIATNISSNLNWPIPVDPYEIVASGLEYLTCSIDGVDQDSYAEYRVKGNVDEAFENLSRVIAARKAMKKKTPFVEWQFIVFRHNEHEIDRAREMAHKLGVDYLRFVSPALQPEDYENREMRDRYMPTNPIFLQRDPLLEKERGYIHDQPCYYLYRLMAIHPGGGLTPCCFVHDHRQDFGDIVHQPVQEIWNNAQYRSARALFSRKTKKNGEDRVPVICDVCPIFRKTAPPARASKPQELTIIQ